MAVPLSQLLAELPETTRVSTTGSLDNTKRTRAINRVLQDLQDFADWDFTKRTKEFEFIDGIFEYSLENYIGATCNDNDGSTSIPDFKSADDLRLKNESYNGQFDYKEKAKDVRYNIQKNRHINEYSHAEGLLIINYPRQTSAQLHNCDSLTANGTVAASSDAINLTIDTVEFQEGSGALNFDVSVGTSLVITFTGINSKDLTELQNKSHFTLDAFLPTITNFTSIQLEWGDDASNNWSKTETAPAGNVSLATGWNKFAFKWGDASENGSPVVSSVDWLRVTITFSASTTDTDFRIDNIRVGGSVKMELDYFSLAMVKNENGNHQLEFNAGDVTQTDVLVGPESRRTVIEGTTHELFEIIGGKSERDRTDSFSKYEAKKVELMKRSGHRIRRGSKSLNFPGHR